VAEAEQNGEQHDSPMMAELNERYESALASLEEEVRSSAHSCLARSTTAPAGLLMLCRVRRLQLNAEPTILPSTTDAEAFEALRAYIGDKLLAGTAGKLYTYTQRGRLWRAKVQACHGLHGAEGWPPRAAVRWRLLAAACARACTSCPHAALAAPRSYATFSEPPTADEKQAAVELLAGASGASY
jgi:hypothetical protein